jgi:hypothetical protein
MTQPGRLAAAHRRPDPSSGGRGLLLPSAQHALGSHRRLRHPGRRPQSEGRRRRPTMSRPAPLKPAVEAASPSSLSLASPGSGTWPTRSPGLMRHARTRVTPEAWTSVSSALPMCPAVERGSPSRAAVLMVPRNALPMGLGGGRFAWLAAVQRSFRPPVPPRLLCTDCSRLSERVSIGDRRGCGVIGV